MQKLISSKPPIQSTTFDKQKRVIERSPIMASVAVGSVFTNLINSYTVNGQVGRLEKEVREFRDEY